jgi:hypothetical protein
MLLIIVATGNHFLFDAAAGFLVVAAGWFVAARLRAPATAFTPPVRLPAPQDTWTPHSSPARAQAA